MGGIVVAVALKVAALDLDATGVEPELARNVSEVFVAKIGELGCCSVISSGDIKSMLGLEQQKQMLDCKDEGACVAEIGGALGVDKLATGNVGAWARPGCSR